MLDWQKDCLWSTTSRMVVMIFILTFFTSKDLPRNTVFWASGSNWYTNSMALLIAPNTDSWIDPMLPINKSWNNLLKSTKYNRQVCSSSGFKTLYSMQRWSCCETKEKDSICFELRSKSKTRTSLVMQSWKLFVITTVFYHYLLCQLYWSHCMYEVWLIVTSKKMKRRNKIIEHQLDTYVLIDSCDVRLRHH